MKHVFMMSEANAAGQEGAVVTSFSADFSCIGSRLPCHLLKNQKKCKAVSLLAVNIPGSDTVK